MSHLSVTLGAVCPVCAVSVIRLRYSPRMLVYLVNNEGIIIITYCLVLVMRRRSACCVMLVGNQSSAMLAADEL